MLSGKIQVRSLDRLAVPSLAFAAGAAALFSFFAPADQTAARGQFAVERPAPVRSAFGPNLTSAAANGRDVHVGVFGDSFGDGIWWGLEQQLRSEDRIEVHRLSRAATGFTTYQIVNLLDDTRARLDRQPIDIAILSFGANDTQGIYADGVPAQYMSDAWQRTIGARVDAVMALLRSRGVQVYWIGLPKMRSPRYDANAQLMNAFYTARMRALNATFIDTVPITADAGNFSPYLPDPRTGRPASARARDGIHMTMTGYLILTHDLADRIRSTVELARAQHGDIGARQAAANPAQRRSGSPG